MLSEKKGDNKMSIAFTVTDLAATKIKAIREQENKSQCGLRIRIAGGGCSGPKYQLGLDEKADEGDLVVESNGLHVFIDPESAEWMNDASIDYVESSMGGGFKIINPNIEAKSGGCGSGGCGSGGCGSHEGHGDEHGHDHGDDHGKSSGGGCGSGGGGCG